MVIFTECNCTGCGCSLCMWHQFSGFDLAERLMNNNLKAINESIDSYNCKEDLVKAADIKVTLTRTRMWELWKEYFGLQIPVCDMNIWQDYVDYGDIIMSQSPPCIHYYICNFLPYFQIHHYSMIVMTKLSYIQNHDSMLIWKKVFVDATFYVPSTSTFR